MDVEPTASGTPPRCSVVIAVRDRESTIAAAIRSLLQQTVADVEVIVVDDGSTDATSAAAGVAAGGDPRVAVFRQPNAGPGAARNAGARRATSPILAFLDSDDEADPAWAESLLHGFEDPACAAACCGARRRSATAAEEIVRPSPLGPAFAGMVGLFNAGTFAVRASLFAAVGGYASGLRFSENTELAIRLTARCRAEGWTIAVVPEPLLMWNIRESRDYSPQVLLDSAEYILHHHRAALAADRTVLADYEAICGVNAARLGRSAAARRHFVGALRARPSWRAAGRLAAAMLPPVAGRVWPAPQSVARW